jgi:hypothetical protein
MCHQPRSLAVSLQIFMTSEWFTCNSHYLPSKYATLLEGLRMNTTCRGSSRCQRAHVSQDTFPCTESMQSLFCDKSQLLATATICLASMQPCRKGCA